MIKIVVCDDTLTEINKIDHLLAEFNANFLSIDYRVYSSSLELSQNSKIIESTDIFLLDIVMPDITGIDLGKLIRSKNKDASIIFLTTSKDYALDAYGIQALQYLVKPVIKEELYDAIQKGIVYANKKERYYSIQTRSDLIPVKVNDIKYIEYKEHFLHFYVNDKILISKFYRSAFEIAIHDLFEHEDFILAHRAYLVNMCHVKKMDSTSFEMDNHHIVPISKSRLAFTRKTYMDFLLRG